MPYSQEYLNLLPPGGRATLPRIVDKYVVPTVAEDNWEQAMIDSGEMLDTLLLVSRPDPNYIATTFPDGTVHYMPRDMFTPRFSEGIEPSNDLFYLISGLRGAQWLGKHLWNAYDLGIKDWATRDARAEFENGELAWEPLYYANPDGTISLGSTGYPSSGAMALPEAMPVTPSLGAVSETVPVLTPTVPAVEGLERGREALANTTFPVADTELSDPLMMARKKKPEPPADHPQIPGMEETAESAVDFGPINSRLDELINKMNNLGNSTAEKLTQLGVRLDAVEASQKPVTPVEAEKPAEKPAEGEKPSEKPQETLGLANAQELQPSERPDGNGSDKLDKFLKGTETARKVVRKIVPKPVRVAGKWLPWILAAAAGTGYVVNKVTEGAGNTARSAKEGWNKGYYGDGLNTDPNQLPNDTTRNSETATNPDSIPPIEVNNTGTNSDQGNNQGNNNQGNAGQGGTGNTGQGTTSGGAVTGAEENETPDPGRSGKIFEQANRINNIRNARNSL